MDFESGTTTEGVMGEVGKTYPMVLGCELGDSRWNGKTVSILARIAQVVGGEVTAVTTDGVTITLEKNPGDELLDNVLIRGTVNLQMAGASVEIRIRDEGSVSMTEEHSDTELYSEIVCTFL